MADEEELILRVRLDDQASASLSKMREQMKDAQGSGGGGRRANEEHAQRNQHMARGLNLQKQATEGLAAWSGVAKAAGLAGSALYVMTGNLSVELAKMGANFAQRAGDLRGFAERMRELEHGARGVGETAAQFKSLVSTLKAAGLTADEAEGHIRGIIAAQNDMLRVNSAVRQELLTQARALGTEGVRDMEKWIQSVEGAGSADLVNKVLDQSRKIREAWEARGQPRLGAERQQEFLGAFDARKLDQMRQRARETSEEEKEFYERRIEDANKYNDALIRLGKGVDHVADSIVALRLRFLPLTSGVESAADAVEKLLRGLHAVEEFSRKTPEERAKAVGTFAKEKVGEAKETVGSPKVAPWLPLIPGSPLLFSLPGFRKPIEKGLEDTWLQKLIPKTENQTKETEKNTKQLEQLNETLKPMSFTPAGDIIGPGAPGFGGMRGAGFGQLIGRGGTSTTPISLPYGSQVGPGTGAGAEPGGQAPSGRAPPGGQAPSGRAPPGGQAPPGAPPPLGGGDLKVPTSLSEAPNTLQEARDRGFMGPSGGGGSGGAGAGGLDPMTEFIKQKEGFEPKAKWDVKQYSVGYGTKATGPGETITREQASKRLSDELGKARASVDKFAPNAPQGVKDALTSLTYNAGTDWQKDGLGRAIQAGEYDKAKGIFGQYNKAVDKSGNKVVLAGLTARRQAELQYWDKPGGAAGAPAGTAPGGAGGGGGGGRFTTGGIGQAVRGGEPGAGGAVGGAGTEAQRKTDEYLWQIYQNTPKVDSTGDFTQKDPKAAARLGISTKDYVIGGMSRELKDRLAREFKETEKQGGKPQMTSGFRDDYRQSLITSGVRASVGGSRHGGSRATGGFGLGEAADVDRATANRIAGGRGGLVRPMPDYDPTHVQVVREKDGKLTSGKLAPLAPTARDDLDRQKLDRDRQQNVIVTGDGKLSVDVKAPQGTRVAAEGNGLFKRTHIKREHTGMQEAASSPSSGEEE